MIRSSRICGDRVGLRSIQVATGITLALCLAACNPPGKPVGEELANENRLEIADFETIYATNCAGCHGDNGKNGPARILNDSLYLTIMPKETLREVVEYGRKGTAMPPWALSQGGTLTDKQIDILVNGMYSHWGKPVKLNGAVPAYEGNIANGDVTRGKKVFARGCFMCHGPGARVGPVTDPNYLALSSDQMIRTSVIVGRPDFGMPDYRFLNLGKALSDQDVTDVVTYLASLRPQGLGEQMGATGGGNAGQQAGATGSHENENGTGKSGASSKGNEGSGTGPGSPRQQSGEGNKGKGSSSQQGVK